MSAFIIYIVDILFLNLIYYVLYISNIIKYKIENHIQRNYSTPRTREVVLRGKVTI
jgi:hypothetical protein